MKERIYQKSKIFEKKQELLKQVHGRKTEIEEDFVEQIDKEIETNIRKGVRP